MSANLDFARAHLAEIQDAADRIQPYIRHTPALTVDLDPRLVLKPECFQVTGSFKARGAFNAVLKLDPKPRGVVTASSGNHAQAVALAARTAGIPALILIPEDANPAKVAATRAYGAEVVSEGITFANRDDKLVEAAERSGYILVHPYDDWDVIHGQGTGALELMADASGPRGGGLPGWWRRPDQRLGPGDQGDEPLDPGDRGRAGSGGRRLPLLPTRTLQRLTGPAETIADGVKTVSLGAKNFEVLVGNGLMDDIVTVTEQEIEQALLTAWLRCKLALEPTGALTLAAFLAGKLPAAGRIGLVLSGGNADAALVARLLQ